MVKEEMMMIRYRFLFAALMAVFLFASCDIHDIDYDALPFDGHILPRRTGYGGHSQKTNDWIYFNVRTGKVFNRRAYGEDFKDAGQFEIDRRRDFPGLRGLQGKSGKMGVKFGDLFFHIKYKNVMGGTSGLSGEKPGELIGCYVDNVEEDIKLDNESEERFLWSDMDHLRKDSLNGIPGYSSSGVMYLHVKYSNDGKSFSEPSGETVESPWIGVRVDNLKADSEVFDDYLWAENDEQTQYFSSDWDIAFCGYKIRTNSGTSGVGLGGAFDGGPGGYEQWKSASDIPSDADWVVDNDKNVTVTFSENDWNHYCISHNLMPLADYPWFTNNTGPRQFATSANPLLDNVIRLSGPPMVFEPSYHTYIVRCADGHSFFKLQVVSWFNTKQQMGDSGGQISYYMDMLDGD